MRTIGRRQALQAVGKLRFVQSIFKRLYWRMLWRLSPLPLVGGWFFDRWLKTPPGREFVVAMILPIKRLIDYEGFMRKCLTIRPLPIKELLDHEGLKRKILPIED